jgi:hypothetical protein
VYVQQTRCEPPLTKYPDKTNLENDVQLVPLPDDGELHGACPVPGHGIQDAADSPAHHHQPSHFQIAIIFLKSNNVTKHKKSLRKETEVLNPG